jgi:hypothetical protein
VRFQDDEVIVTVPNLEESFARFPQLAKYQTSSFNFAKIFKSFLTIRLNPSLFLKGSFCFSKELQVRKDLRLIANTGDTDADEVCAARLDRERSNK